MHTYLFVPIDFEVPYLSGFFVCFLVGPGFELVFMLGKQVLYCLSYMSSPFCSGYFGDGGFTSYLPRLGK
jgi:hypothetical protein